MARVMTVTLASLAGATLTAYAGLQVLGRVAGTTCAERRRRLPGDDLIDPATIVTEHAIDIAAERQDVWPWLTQIGWHLGGYYTPDWIDRLVFPGNWPSLDRLDPALVRDLRVGDVIPDGPPGTAFFVVSAVEPPHVLVLRSTTHLPPGWQQHGAAIDWTWCFSLTRTAPQQTRVHLRVRGRTAPWWLTTLYQAGIVPADYVMAMGMLRGLKQRVEAHQLPAASGRAPVDQGAYPANREPVAGSAGQVARAKRSAADVSPVCVVDREGKSAAE